MRPEVVSFLCRVTLSEVISVFDFRTDIALEDLDLVKDKNYLLSPVTVAGLRPTLRQGLWKNIGNVPLVKSDNEVPDFKGGIVLGKK